MRTIGLTLCWDRWLGSSIVSLSVMIILVYRLSGNNWRHRPYWTWCTIMRLVWRRWCASVSWWTWTGTIGIGRTSMVGLRWLGSVAGVVCARRRRESCRWRRWPVLVLCLDLGFGRTVSGRFMIRIALIEIGVAIFDTIQRLGVIGLLG